MLALKLPKCVSHLEGNDTWIEEEYTRFCEYYVVNLLPTKNRKKKKNVNCRLLPKLLELINC